MRAEGTSNVSDRVAAFEWRRVQGGFLSKRAQKCHWFASWRLMGFLPAPGPGILTTANVALEIYATSRVVQEIQCHQTVRLVESQHGKAHLLSMRNRELPSRTRKESLMLTPCVRRQTNKATRNMQ